MDAASPTGPDAPDPTGLDRRRFLGTGAAAGAALLALGEPALTDAASRTRTPRHHRAGSRSVSAPGLPAPRPIYAAHADPADLGTTQAASLLQAGLLSSRELLQACQARIAARNGPVSFQGSPSAINAWVRLYPDFAQRLACDADRRLAAGRRRRRPATALCGLPLGLTDLYAVEGFPLTASSKVLAGNVATGNSAAWDRLGRAGMVLCGHTHTDEFAFLAVTPQCGNPWNTSLITGGSSGGSAAALASRQIPAAMGSDTLGSLRIPAAFCGVSSIKPTFGLVSAYGVIPLAWALDHCGPMGRSVADCSLMLSTLAGEDANDPSTDIAAPRPVRYPTLPRRGRRPLAGTRIGLPRGLGTPDAGPGEIYARTCAELKALGATLIDVAMPPNPFDPNQGPLQFYTDALSYHRHWYPSRSSDYKTPAAQMLSLIQGENLTALEYLALHRTRAAFQSDWKAALAEHRLDAVAFLVSLGDPPARSNPAVQSPASNPENAKLLTFIFSYLGFPVVTVPGGASSATQLPVGIQLGGAPFTEAKLIQVAVDLKARFPHFAEAPSGKSSGAAVGLPSSTSPIVPVGPPLPSLPVPLPGLP
jgi:aspartyl-tRNA(Asn)/glutamyl-tRNA(Gln) amidotransferase subunit A